MDRRAIRVFPVPAFTDRVGDSDLVWMALEDVFWVVAGSRADAATDDLNEVQRDLAALLFVWVTLESDGIGSGFADEWLPEAISAASRIGANELVRLLTLVMQGASGEGIAKALDQQRPWFLDAELFIVEHATLFFRPAPLDTESAPLGGFTQEWATWTVARLVDCHFDVHAPLVQREVDALGEAFGATVPAELAVLLTTKVPVSMASVMWHTDARRLADMSRNWIVDAFRADVLLGGFWHPVLGQRPTSEHDIMAAVTRAVASAPVLFPLFGDRYMVALPDAPRPVISFPCPTKAFLKGNDLADFLHHDYGIEKPIWSADSCGVIPFWGSLLGSPAVLLNEVEAEATLDT
jgi:hypothetical protein